MITHEIARDMVINNIIEWFREELLAYISQQEQFAKDVARYFELFDKYLINTQTVEEMHERWGLEAKLRKVGKEE